MSRSSYLCWPCSFDLPKCNDLHITAKYLGKEGLNLGAIQALLKDVPTNIITDKISWTPHQWDTPKGPAYVLLLSGLPKNVQQVHDALTPLRADDHPSYNPHITVPKNIHAQIVTEKLQPSTLNLVIGPLLAYDCGTPIHAF